MSRALSFNLVFFKTTSKFVQTPCNVYKPFSIVMRELWILCDVYLLVLMFVYQFELVNLRAI